MAATLREFVVALADADADASAAAVKMKSIFRAATFR